ncbi:unnamed protein product [Symbiodinium pilosum]|uniref:Uncharacterized protein n=1 Tax=Symbiodinium pilosum TaxID=2952 RepID=A0A812KIX1_SYMPI|nr:unnamed protein product [Symbiodinium pilosum]
MEAFLGVGLVAGEIFRYNRQNFAFDQDQRFRRDELRLKMQVERFRLFRQDIRDLVELTVGKMDLYHMVGALFIRMISIYYSEGFFEEAPPVFLQVAYYLSQACSLVYLLMAIWLSMHASIKSHSYATRLLTRFVRLPIPGCGQLDVLNARLSDCESQAAQLLRVPFLQSGRNAWKDRAAVEGDALPGEPREVNAVPAPKPTGDELEDGEFAYGGEHNMLGHEELLHAVEFRTRRHVQLFRQLQARWQCFDAYSRVCMSLGVRHMLQSINYYLLGLCMVQMYDPVVGFVLTVVFQALACNMTILDVHGLPCLGGLDLSFIGFLPAIAACVSLTLAERGEDGDLASNNAYPVSVAIYPLEIAWFELLHWVASPASDESSIPRHFRAVLFMDVFGEAEDPTEIAMTKKGSMFSGVNAVVLVEKVQLIQDALQRAQAAMRRWEEVPGAWLTLRQRKELEKLSDDLRLEMAGLGELLSECDMEVEIARMREWPELSSVERQLDHFKGTVLGPFHYINSSGLPADYYWDIENTVANGSHKLLYDPAGSAPALTLEDAAETVRDFQHLMDDIRRMSHFAAEKPNGKSKGRSDSDEAASDRTPRASAIKGAFTARETKELYKPIRLPWRTVSCLTRTIQIIWLGVGVFAGMRESGVMLFDHQVSYIVEERRLQNAILVEKEELQMLWPYGIFFRIEALQCHLCEHAQMLGTSPIIASTHFARYALHNSSLQEMSFAEEDMFCGPGIGCFAACRLSSGLAIGESRLQLPSGTGRLSGALSHCKARKNGHGQVCLHLAVEGQDQRLQVLHVELPEPSADGPHAGCRDCATRGICHGMLSAWAADVPVNSHGGHLAAFVLQGGCLWLLSSGLLEAWSVQAEPYLLRQWEVDLPADFQPTAMCRHQDCERADSRLLVAGHSSRGPGLLQLLPVGGRA